MKKIIEFIRTNVQTIIAVLTALNTVGVIVAIALLFNFYSQVEVVSSTLKTLVYMEMAESLDEDAEETFPSWILETLAKRLYVGKMGTKSDAEATIPRFQDFSDSNESNYKHEEFTTETIANETMVDEEMSTYVESSVDANVHKIEAVCVTRPETTNIYDTKTEKSTTQTTMKAVNVNFSYPGDREQLIETLSEMFIDGESVEIHNVPYYEKYTLHYEHDNYQEGGYVNENEIVYNFSPEWEYILAVRNKDGIILKNFIFGKNSNYIDPEIDNLNISNVIKLENTYYSAEAIIDKLLEGQKLPEKLASVIVWTSESE